MTMRFDLQVIASWIEPGSRVLDLGSSRGTLLSHLQQERDVRGTGIEKDEAKVAESIARGLSVVQGDIDAEIRDYPDKMFDVVVLSQTLQQIPDPPGLIREMLRVGSRGIVSFPNFSYWRIRTQQLLFGRAPITRELPHRWYDTPNIRFITIRDFREFCKAQGISILKQVHIDSDYHDTKGHVLRILPNLRATYGIFMIGGAG